MDGDVNIHDTHLVNVVYDSVAEFDASGVEIDLAPCNVLELPFDVGHRPVRRRSEESGPNYINLQLCMSKIGIKKLLLRK